MISKVKVDFLSGESIEKILDSTFEVMEDVGADIFCALFVFEKSAYTRKSPAGVLNRNFWRKTGSWRRGGNRICL